MTFGLVTREEIRFQETTSRFRQKVRSFGNFRFMKLVSLELYKQLKYCEHS